MAVVNSVVVLRSFVLNNALLCFVFWLLFVLCVVWFGFGGLFDVLCDFALLFVFGTCLRLELLGVVSLCGFWCFDLGGVVCRVVSGVWLWL